MNTGLKTLAKPVFMDSGSGPSGRPGMTVLLVTFKLRHYAAVETFIGVARGGFEP
jgi:hypothetical protein